MLSYSRGNGGITLSSTQRTQLQTVLDEQTAAFELSSNDVGLGVPIYDLLMSFISDTNEADDYVPKAR